MLAWYLKTSHAHFQDVNNVLLLHARIVHRDGFRVDKSYGNEQRERITNVVILELKGRINMATTRKKFGGN
jgi:hypothetical protein